ncbi:MAG: hypothetical protein HFG34_05140 [Eubacterium sp.]|nr:hypothetical protein [Eubacterium sp.]
MEKIKGTKCEFGYIQKQKTFQSLMLLLFVAVGVGLFLTGLLITGTRANIFTVLGILMVLPAAKRIIALVVMVPRKSVDKERYDQMQETVAEEGILYTDYVFTSPDKIMSFDFLIIQNQNVMGILSEKKQEEAYILEYLQKGVDSQASGYRVKLFSTDEEFYKFYRRLTEGSSKQERDEEYMAKQDKVSEYLKILAV